MHYETNTGRVSHKTWQDAHLLTLQSLLSLYCEAFFKQVPQIYKTCAELADTLNQTCIIGKEEMIQSSWSNLLQQFEKMNLYQQFSAFDKSQIDKPIFKFLHTYMNMVSIMTTFVRVVRSGDWNLHLTYIKQFLKYFFSQNRLNYA